jgi:dUTP pyrophosphatase
MTVEIKLLHTDAQIPEKATYGSAGYDLTSVDQEDIFPGETKVVGLGFAMSMPPDMCAFICSRSGLAAKKSVYVLNAPGIIDSDYTGELKVVLTNLGKTPFRISVGDRVAQMVFHHVPDVDVDQVDLLMHYGSARGDGGFGSTGGTSE